MRTGLNGAARLAALALLLTRAAACSTASPSASGGETDLESSTGAATTSATDESATADPSAGTTAATTTSDDSDDSGESGESDATTGAPAGPCDLPLVAPLDLTPGLQGSCGFTTTHFGRVATENVRQCLDPSCNTCTNDELFPLDQLPPDALPPGACVHFEHRSEMTESGCESIALALWEGAPEGAPLLLAGARLGSPEVIADVGLPPVELAAAGPIACGCEEDSELGCCGGELTRFELEMTPAGGAPVTIAAGASAPLSLGDEPYVASVTVAHAGSSCAAPRDFVTWFLVHS